MTNKLSGIKSDFAVIREDESRIIVSYGLKKLSKTSYEWYEIYFYKKQHSQISLADVKAAIIADIDARTDEKILTGFVWTPEGGDPINVWLSMENQRNFSEAQRMASANEAILPLTFKLGENENGAAVYHTFATSSELNAFYLAAFAYINQCLNEGWAIKDGIDWTPYESVFAPSEPNESAE